MKKTNMILLFCCIWLLGGCNDFLEEVSEDEIVPKSVQDYSEFLYGEAYVRDKKTLHPYLDIMTDDVREQAESGTPSYFSPDARISGYGYYAWQQVPEYQTSGALNSDISWETYYHYILICNIVLKGIDEAKGEESLRNQVKGEAYLIRAYSYFMLVNLYGKPYDESTAASDLGVPLNSLDYMEDRKFYRESVARIYEEIIQNLDKGLEALGRSSEDKNKFRWNIDAARVFASRVYLYMKKYDRVIEYATEAINVRPVLYDLNSKANDTKQMELAFLNPDNPEILFSFGSSYNEYNAPGLGCFPVSDELIGMYKDDWRYGYSDGVFIRKKGNFLAGTAVLQYKNRSETGVYGYAIRSAEAYLNRAEACAETGEKELAMADINKIRQARIKTSAYKSLSAADRQTAVQYVREERRKELCFEGHRWFDLRRWDRPRIEHTYTRSFNPVLIETYILEKDDPGYTLPIPKTILDYEPNLKNNVRPERKPV